MMTDDQILEVVQAHKDGRLIQGRKPNGSNVWVDFDLSNFIAWNFSDHEYRVAPEPRKPREWWIIPRLCSAYDCPQKGFEMEQVHVREVMDDSEGIKQAFRKAVDCI